MGEGRWLRSGPGPPRYHREGERVDNSAAVPGTPAVSQGQAHEAGTGERRQLSGGPGHPSDVTGKGRGETAQRRPWAPQQCHREEERGDGSAAAPGTPVVSLGRGERRRLSGGSGHPGGVTGKGTRGRHGWSQRGRGRHRQEAAGSVAPGTSAPCQLWWKGGPDGERVLPHRAAGSKEKAEDTELCGALQLEKE